jgi:large subunit ribosomal protein L10
VQNAITRQRKEETVEVLEGLLAKSAVVVGLRYQGLTVKQLQDFRRSLPADSKMLVCKNTLMRVACDKVGGWDELKPATKGDNAWLFVNEEVRGCWGHAVRMHECMQLEARASQMRRRGDGR